MTWEESVREELASLIRLCTAFGITIDDTKVIDGHLARIRDITLGERLYTGYCDRTGTKIYIDDQLEFVDKYSGAVWRGWVEFDDGYPTISILDVENVKNPKDWKEKHDWVDSRWWSIKVGMSETGSWDWARASLPKIAGYFETSEEFFKVKDMFNEKYGEYASNDELQRQLPVTITGSRETKSWKTKQIPYMQDIATIRKELGE